jgi:hypothetical protein
VSGVVYQITQSTAKLCSSLPLPNPNLLERLARWTDHWQTLAGAVIGGLLGVVAALVVAAMAARRERRIAAGMLLPEVQQLAAAQQGLMAFLDKWAVTDPIERQKLLSRKLVEEKPVITALYTPMIAQVSDIDARLYSHLFQCQMTLRSFEAALASFAENDQIFRAQQKTATQSAHSGVPLTQAFHEEAGHTEAMLQYHASRAVWAWNYCTAHAEMANYFLDRLIFSHWPRPLAKLRMFLRPSDLDRRSMKFLTTGKLPSEETT